MPEIEPTYEELKDALAKANRRITELEKHVQDLLKKLEEANRKPRRQAGPFGRDDAPKKKPKKPGRKQGKGKWMTRRPPDPSEVTEVLEAELPEGSPCCGCSVRTTKIMDQFQTDLPEVRPVVRHFRVHVGECTGCGKRVQGRHEKQTSDALGAAGVQLGPNALAHAALLNKSYGLSWGKIAAFFAKAFNLKATRSAYTQAAVYRLGPAAQRIYDQLVAQIAGGQRSVGADETSWKVAGHLEWLWIFTTKTETVYRIAPSRGFDVIRDVLGEDFDGVLIRDGWAPYAKLKGARHQTCLAHFFKRIADLLEIAKRGEARFPRALRRVLKKALALRDARDWYTDHGFAIQVGKVSAELRRLLRWRPEYGPNRRFAAHLRREQDAVLTFLRHPEADATNWRAEQGLRPAVVNRKVCGGNRTRRGAQVQQILTSVIRTCTQRSQDALDLLVRLLRGDPAELIPAAPS